MKEEEWEKLTNCEKLRCKISDLDLSEGTKNDLVFELTNIEDEISELQEENEKFKEYARSYLKSKIDKALELTKELKEKYFNKCVAGGALDMMKLENILQGEDK